MGRDLSCASGRRAYKTKRDVLAEHPRSDARRCDRCRFWHAHAKRRRKASQLRPGTGRGAK